LAALAARGLVLFPEGEGPPDRTQIVEAFRQAGCEPRIVQEASPTLAVLACVAAGLGASLLPDCVGFTGMKGVRIRRIHPRRKLVDRFWKACLDQAPVAG
jgi:DNA-binding transcriptional LysR family regulator